MNGKPHTHKITLAHEYGASGGWLEVTYGDTTVKVAPRILRGVGCFLSRPSQPSQERIDRAIAEAIRKHDEGSRRSAQADERLRTIEAEFDHQRTTDTMDTWGSDTLLRRGGDQGE